MRKGLRLYADRLMKAAAQIPLPQTFLEGARAARYAQSCDRLLTQLYAPPKAKPLPLEYDDEQDTWTFKPRSRGVHPDDVRHPWADWQFKLEEKLLAKPDPEGKRARETGFWDDGKPYVPPVVIQGPQRYNPDGSILETYEALKHNLAMQRAAQDAANKAHGWTPPAKPDDPTDPP